MMVSLIVLAIERTKLLIINQLVITEINQLIITRHSWRTGLEGISTEANFTRTNGEVVSDGTNRVDATSVGTRVKTFPADTCFSFRTISV